MFVCCLFLFVASECLWWGGGKSRYGEASFDGNYRPKLPTGLTWAAFSACAARIPLVLRSRCARLALAPRSPRARVPLVFRSCSARVPLVLQVGRGVTLEPFDPLVLVLRRGGKRSKG